MAAAPPSRSPPAAPPPAAYLPAAPREEGAYRRLRGHGASLHGREKGSWVSRGGTAAIRLPGPGRGGPARGQRGGPGGGGGAGPAWPHSLHFAGRLRDRGRRLRGFPQVRRRGGGVGCGQLTRLARPPPSAARPGPAASGRARDQPPGPRGDPTASGARQGKEPARPAAPLSSGGAARTAATCGRASPRRARGAADPRGEPAELRDRPALPRAGGSPWPHGQGRAELGGAAPGGPLKTPGVGSGLIRAPCPALPAPCPHPSRPHPGPSSARPVLRRQRPRPAQLTKKTPKIWTPGVGWAGSVPGAPTG